MRLSRQVPTTARELTAIFHSCVIYIVHRTWPTAQMSCGTISCRVRAAIVVDPLIENRSINRMFDSSTWCCIAPMTCCPTIERSSVTATSCKLIDFRSRFDPQLLHVWWNMITYTMSHDGWFGKFSTSTVEWSWVNKNIYAMELVPTWFSQCINSVC